MQIYGNPLYPGDGPTHAFQAPKSRLVKFPSGRTGWKLRIAHSHPLATVAYDDGRIYVGGGYGSHKFYAIDANTGSVIWVCKTGDDGPTAAVVKRDYVVFNTESCTIYVLRTRTGEKVWEKWLGDPLMSQPAVDDNNVYMVYPDKDHTHHLVAMVLENGKPIWDAQITGDVISAPIVDKDSVYVTCFDGTVCRYDTTNGQLVWSQQKKATCAPKICDDRIFLGIREQHEIANDSAQTYEGLATLMGASGAQEQKELWAKEPAPYLVYGRASANVRTQYLLDASVGFGSPPIGARLDQAEANIGQHSVVGCWAYQGSRPIVRNGHAYNTVADKIQAIDINTGEKVWSQKYSVKEEGIGGRVLTPPAYANGKLFLGTGKGDVLCLRENDGQVVWQEKVDGAVSFQPAIARGMVYISCDNGLLYGINTNDQNDDGWYMWGGNSEHNK